MIIAFSYLVSCDMNICGYPSQVDNAVDLASFQRHLSEASLLCGEWPCRPSKVISAQVVNGSPVGQCFCEHTLSFAEQRVGVSTAFVVSQPMVVCFLKK